MLTFNEVEKILQDAEVLLKGHFLLTSGRHSDKYMQCARIFKDSKVSEILCKELAEAFKDDKIDVVIGPAIGAILISYETSRQLGVPNIFCERQDGEMVLRRSFEIEKGQRVLVVEDVITTGGSVRETIDVVNKAGGVVVGVGSIVDRTNGEVDFGVPFKAVYSAKVESFTADECPLCKEGKIDLVKPGSKNMKK